MKRPGKSVHLLNVDPSLDILNVGCTLYFLTVAGTFAMCKINYAVYYQGRNMPILSWEIYE